MTEIFPLFIILAALLYLIAAIRDFRLRPRLVELALLCLLLSVVPPLVGFTFIFGDPYRPTYASYLGSCQCATAPRQCHRKQCGSLWQVGAAVLSCCCGLIAGISVRFAAGDFYRSGGADVPH